jgi:NaMN:DMB phosphoribosyltransferase
MPDERDRAGGAEPAATQPAVAAPTEPAADRAAGDAAPATLAGVAGATGALRLPGRDAAVRALAAFGGLEVAVQVGVILAAASVHVPVVLDDSGTWASALVAVAMAPEVAGYLIASHGGARPGHRRALRVLGLDPLFDLGLAHGEGTGALLALPLLDSAARVLVELGPITR